MDKNEKLKVYEQFKERKEEDIIKNKGETYTYGDTEITIRELPWLDADKFEDKVLELVNEITSLLNTTVDDENIIESLAKMNIAQILEKFLKSILRQGLVDLGNIATKGEITMDSIIEHNVTKSQVIKIVTRAIILNYGYVKNLIPLAAFN